MADTGIVRNRLKVEAAMANARAALPVIEEHGSLAAFFWRFRPESHVSPRARADWVAQSPESKALAKELKKRGFRFVGPTTAYSLMQAAASSMTTPRDAASTARSRRNSWRRRRGSPDDRRGTFPASGIPPSRPFL